MEIVDKDMQVTLSATSPHDILAYLKNNTGFGLYFINVELNSDMDGITLAEKIGLYAPRGFIVFISSCSAKISLTFQYKLEVMDFIVEGDPTIAI